MLAKRLTHLLLFFAFALPFCGFSQVDVDDTMTVEELVTEVLLGNGVTVSNITFNGQPADQVNVQAGRFFGTSNVIEFPEALVMGTGNIRDLVTGDFAGPGITDEFENDPDLVEISGFNINDAAVLEFDFVPNGDSLLFRYVFASTEYPGFTCSSFNDAFGFFISGPGITGPFTNNAINIALIPGTDIPVGVNTVNSGVPSGGNPGPCEQANPNWIEDSQYFQPNDNPGEGEVAIPGMTVTLTAYAQVQCGQEYHIKLAIGDASDGALDSGVFLEAGSFTSNSAVQVNLDIPVGINDSTLYEGCGNAFLQFVRPASSSGIQEIAYLEITGSAVNGVDFEPQLPDSIIFPEGVDTVNISLTAPFDGINEGEETVTVTITNVASECSGAVLTSDFQFYIREPDPLTVEGFDGALEDCNDDIELYPIITGGYGEYSFDWSNGMTEDTITVSPGFTTTYFVIVSDTCGIDPLTTQFEVEVPVYPPLVTELGDDVVVNECDVTLDIAPEFVQGGFGNYYYSWYADGELISEDPQISFLVEATTVISVEITDDCGALATDEILVELPPVEVQAILPDGYVAETCLDGFLLPVIAEGGIGQLSFTWKVDQWEDSVVTTQPFFDYHPSMGQLVIVKAEDECQNIMIDSTFVEYDFPKVSLRISSDTSICEGTQAFLWAQASEGSGFFKYSWDSAPDSSETLTVKPVADRTYFLTVEDTCGMSADASVNVEIREVLADFDYAYLDYYGLSFTNYSRGEQLTYLWDFGDGNFSEEEDPKHFYNDIEEYTVILESTDMMGCSDTAVFYTIPPSEIFIPSGFTPNGDGINDLFGVVGENITDFEMWIYDRWGKQVFYSNEITKKWNGSSQDGEYYPGTTTFNYLIKYKGVREEDATEVTGFITIVR